MGPPCRRRGPLPFPPSRSLTRGSPLSAPCPRLPSSLCLCRSGPLVSRRLPPAPSPARPTASSPGTAAPLLVVRSVHFPFCLIKAFHHPAADLLPSFVLPGFLFLPSAALRRLCHPSPPHLNSPSLFTPPPIDRVSGIVCFWRGSPAPLLVGSLGGSSPRRSPSPRAAVLRRQPPRSIALPW